MSRPTGRRGAAGAGAGPVRRRDTGHRGATEALADAASTDPATADLVAGCADTLAADGVLWAAMGFWLGASLGCPLAGRGDAAPDELVRFYGGRPPTGDVRTRRVALHGAPEDPRFTAEELARERVLAS